LWAGRAFAQADPEVAAYKAFVGARAVRTERLVLDIPRIADNGNLVPVRIALPGPFAPGAEVKSIHLFSQKNPVAQMAVFHFPVPVGRVEVESRVRLAGTQRVAAVATLADGTLYAATADVIVTVSACIDGT
jgi:sulfur-oxidizing protein SoxY